MTEQPTALDWRDIGFWGEVVCLLLAAPALYLPGRFPTWAPLAALALLAAAWLWRRLLLGNWMIRTPADWAIFLFFAIMLPTAVWAAPPPLRAEYSIPRALILIWNFCLFWLIVVHSSRGTWMWRLFAGGLIGAGTLIALAGLFGTHWQEKVPGIEALVSRLPQFLTGRFTGAEEGFSPNQLAGALLYVIPLVLALGVGALQAKRWWTVAGLALALAIMASVFLLAQSRAGLVGLAASLAILTLGSRRWGRWVLLAITIAILATFLTVPMGDIVARIDGATPITASTAGISFTKRTEIWNRALYGIQDFPLTGMGLGTFRQIVARLYPLFLLAPTVDIAHAHNFFLQSALDFGLPGLVALLAIYILAFVQCCRLYRSSNTFSMAKYWAMGLVAAIIGQAVYSMADAVAMGSKPNFLFWWLLALVFGVTAWIEDP